MKKIALYVQLMLCGGVENTLITLSKKLINEGYDVTVFVIKKKGEFINQIPDGVKLEVISMPEKIRKAIPVGGTTLCIRECIENHEYFQAVKYLVSRFINKNQFAELCVNFDSIPFSEDEFDIAINYHMHSPFLVKFLSEKVKSKHKYTWMHNDFTTTKYDIKKLQKYIDINDGFFGVSQKIVDEFTVIFPDKKKITNVAFNLIPKEEIIIKAGYYKPDEFKKIPEKCLTLLSVGRLEQQKGYDIALQVCKKLKKSGYRFKWFALGDGSLRADLEKIIIDYDIQDVFCFLGIKMNPYPYFKNCDIYVQTSRHEGYATTVSEAMIFCKPIVCTDVSGAREQLKDGISGDIASIDVDSVFLKLSGLIQNPNRQQAYIKELEKEKFDNNAHWMQIFET